MMKAMARTASTKVEIGPLLIVGGAPDRQRLVHHRLPAELVDRGVKAHADGRAENGAEAKHDRPASRCLAKRLNQFLFLELGLGIGALRFQILERAIFRHSCALRAVDAGRGQMDEPRAGFAAGGGDFRGRIEIVGLEFGGAIETCLRHR